MTVHGDAAFQAYDGCRRPPTTTGAGVPLARHLRGVVPDLDAAIRHIRRWSSQHTEAIVTEDQARRAPLHGRRRTPAAVLVNAPTRFTDGGEFGFGAEIGISTQKLHARGPMGLPEMTSTSTSSPVTATCADLRVRPPAPR